MSYSSSYKNWPICKIPASMHPSSEKARFNVLKSVIKFKPSAYTLLLNQYFKKQQNSQGKVCNIFIRINKGLIFLIYKELLQINTKHPPIGKKYVKTLHRGTYTKSLYVYGNAIHNYVGIFF